VLVELAPEEDIQATQPMEVAAKMLAAILQKECGITPTTSVDVPKESGTQPKAVTGGSPRRAQTDKGVTIAETLLNELITWKEMINEERTAELQVPELRQQLARCEE
jgi:hypothetical protein